MISDNFVKLDDISREYFGLGRQSALKHARLGTLPVPAFRLSDSQKSPYLVPRESLDLYVETRKNAAVKLHDKMASV